MSKRALLSRLQRRGGNCSSIRRTHPLKRQQLLKWVAIILLNKLFIVLLFILLKIVGKVAANKKTTLIFHQPNNFSYASLRGRMRGKILNSC